MIIMEKKLKKKMIITQKEHDEWHKKQRTMMERLARNMRFDIESLVLQ